MSNDSLSAGQCSSNNGDKNDNNERVNYKLERSSQTEVKDGFKHDGVLDFLVAQKIIWKLLSIDRIEGNGVRVAKYTKQELASRLRVTVDELDQLIKQKYFYKKLASKIILPLVRLYCSTKWANDDTKI